MGLELGASSFELTKPASSAQEEASRGRNQFCGRPLGGVRAAVSSLGHLGVSWGILVCLGASWGVLVWPRGPSRGANERAKKWAKSEATKRTEEFISLYLTRATRAELSCELAQRQSSGLHSIGRLLVSLCLTLRTGNLPPISTNTKWPISSIESDLLPAELDTEHLFEQPNGANQGQRIRPKVGPENLGGKSGWKMWPEIPRLSRERLSLGGSVAASLGQMAV